MPYIFDGGVYGNQNSAILAVGTRYVIRTYSNHRILRVVKRMNGFEVIIDF